MSNQVIENPFRSFWMAGFECTDQLNAFGNRVDFLHVTSHLEMLQQDYQNLEAFNIKTVREGLRWSQVEKVPYKYDFSTFQQMLEVGRKNGIQQIWDICHFGFPDDLSPLHPHFTRRFAALCRAFALFYKSLGYSEPLIVTPINEVSFMSWLGGDVAGTSPYCHNNGWEVKYGYMRAYIAGVKALKDVDSTIRILTTEPLVNVVANLDATPSEIQDAKNNHELQYQSLDMLCGRICPELGGKPEYLDMLGFNYYYNNQWILSPHKILGWNDEVPYPYLRQLSDLLHEAHKRYNRPVVLTETSHPGIDRPLWIKYVVAQILTTIREEIPFWGICIYPIIDRPNWDHPDKWHHSGLWDMDPAVGIKSRILHEPSAKAVMEGQILLSAQLREAANQKDFNIQKKGAVIL
ncbi:amine oxidase [Dyadobacter frigoris]|uniref:Amine oxidase n=1 Tax=Dyadobacter frigoris TaxID=2576211 RepID=A0A4U6D749_9BACT|nr:amine oxidase [Dyadobacter frigoris]TKT93229.1 amine oxidase [Dyadobacter frigoris]GLU54859.1 beta-glucosidase [Dyadobacter frigoris]